MSEERQTTPDDAIAAGVKLSPAVVLEAIEDPTVFAPMYRGMAVQNLFRLNEQMKNPNVPLRDRLAWQEHCMKYGEVVKQQELNPHGSLPQIVMVFPKRGEQMSLSAPTIEVPVPADE